MSTYKSCRQLCGLTQVDAADFHQVSVDTVKAWDKGRSVPKASVWLELASLWRQIEDACDGAAGAIETGEADIRKVVANLEADIVGNELPMEGARRAAGAMALLVTISEIEEG